MKTTYNSDGGYVINSGGFTFGPYGPGQCEAVHPGSGMACKHDKRHVGNHSTADFTTNAGTFKHRWNTNEGLT